MFKQVKGRFLLSSSKDGSPNIRSSSKTPGNRSSVSERPGSPHNNFPRNAKGRMTYHGNTKRSPALYNGPPNNSPIAADGSAVNPGPSNVGGAGGAGTSGNSQRDGTSSGIMSKIASKFRR